jgi:hypothetical protein
MSVRPLTAPLVLACLLSPSAAGARGWVEKTVTSDSVTMDVERDGSAVVAHEILYGIRGGPLPELSFAPVDADAEVQEDATATLAKSGSAAGFPIPLVATVDGVRLVLKVQVGKGLRSGTYLVRFRYKTNFAGTPHIQPAESGTLVEWTGPSFSDGIDSERTVFRFPDAPTPPRAPSEYTADTANVTDDANGVFLSSVRRGAGKHELELVRPHVAKGQVVTWRAIVDPGTFDPLVKSAVDPAPSPPPKLTTPAHPRPASHRGVTFAALASACLFYGLLVGLKSKWVIELCAARRAVQKPFLPLPMALRCALSALALFGAGACVVETVSPLLAAISLIAALGAAIHLPPRLSPPLRGPGEWVDVTQEESLDLPAAPAPGRFLDVATFAGFAFFAIALAAFAAGAVTVLKHSPFYGVAIGLGSAILFPIFCTGRPSELPLSPAALPADLIDWLLTELGRDPELTLGIIGRVPRGGSRPDELRLKVMPRKPLPGLRAIEIGVDVHQGPLGLLPLPFVIVRALDGSSAADALPKGVYVTRGRGVDERVAVIRPKIPTERVVANLVRNLVARFSLSGPKDKARRQPERSASSSSGKGSVTVNPGTTSSPAHAT